MKILLRRAIMVLVLCVMVAFLIAVEQYITAGEFFEASDIMHHEAIEITILAFGVGYLLSALSFVAYLARDTQI